MEIYIDADGCPVINITVKLAKNQNIPVTIVKNYAHEIQDGYAKIVTVDISSDSADYYIANHIKKEDLLITQDYGLAAMALAKGAFCINQNGHVITNENILSHLSRRHTNQKMRKEKRIYTKIKKRTPEDNLAFTSSLEVLLKNQLQ